MLDIENVFYTQVFRTFNIWPLKLTLNFENVQVLTALPQNECQIFKQDLHYCFFPHLTCWKKDRVFNN